MSFNGAAYDALWGRVDKFIIRVNPCKVEAGRCFRSRCGGDNFCCSGCEHLGPAGCTADKPLACRQWLCDEALGTLTESECEELDQLNEDMHLADFFCVRGTKQDVQYRHTHWSKHKAA